MVESQRPAGRMSSHGITAPTKATSPGAAGPERWTKTAGDARAPGKSWEFFTTFCGKTYVIGKFFVSGPKTVKVSNNCADL